MSITPGPWGYESSLGLILSNEGKVIADPIQGVDDARLIAAAPEMEDILRLIFHKLELSKHGLPFDIDETCKGILALLRRIEGEPDHE